VLARLLGRRLGEARRFEGHSPAAFEVYRAFCRAALAELGVSLEVLGVERVPAEGGLLLMWNQESHLDHLALPAALPRRVLSLYNNAVARTPFYGSYLRRHGHFHVDRTDEAQWRASIGRAAEVARAGACIIVSPEGTRSWDGQLLPMKRGAFILARAARCPVVCITIVGGHERLPRTAFTVRPGVLRVVFGEPIEVTGEAEGLETSVAETFRTTKAAHLGDIASGG
jgi:1-acyl-sn-glycerol-3-phosphate acyltransferase